MAAIDSLPSTHPPPQLYDRPRVCRIAVHESATVAKVAREWERIALEKRALEKEGVSRVQFEKCADLSRSFAVGIEHRLFPFSDQDYLYVVREPDQRISAMMLLCSSSFLFKDRQELYINKLVTHPYNIRSELNKKEPLALKGRATLLLEEAEKIARAHQKLALSLSATLSAVGFYQRFGFQFTDDEEREVYRMAGPFSSRTVDLIKRVL